MAHHQIGSGPDRLKHRAALGIRRRGASDGTSGSEASIGLDLGQPELAAVPGHAGLLPLHPGQLPSARAEGGVAAEIHRTVQRLRFTALQRHGNQLILATGFQHTDPAVVAGIDHAATECSREAAVAAGWGEPLGLWVVATQGEQPEAAISVVYEHGNGLAAVQAADGAGTASVFMDAASQVPRPWGELHGRLIGAAAGHQGGAALLLRALLQPGGNAAEQLGFLDRWGLAQHQLGGEGGRAGAHRGHSAMAPRIA